MTYGAESWVLKEREKERVQAAEMRVCRMIVGVRRMEHVEMTSKHSLGRKKLWSRCAEREKFGRNG